MHDGAIADTKPVNAAGLLEPIAISYIAVGVLGGIAEVVRA